MIGVPRIEELMTRCPKSISVSESIRQAKVDMSKHSVKHLPVVAENKVVGIITDRDIKMAQAISTDPHFHDNAMVKDVNREDVYVVPGSTPVNKVLSYMVENKIGSAIIVDEEQLAGIFTRTDAIKFLLRVLDDYFNPPEERDDA